MGYAKQVYVGGSLRKKGPEIEFENPFKSTWNPKQALLNGSFNWMMNQIFT